MVFSFSLSIVHDKRDRRFLKVERLTSRMKMKRKVGERIKNTRFN